MSGFSLADLVMWNSLPRHIALHIFVM